MTFQKSHDCPRIYFSERSFKYLGSKITEDRGIETEVKSRINDVGKISGGMQVFSCTDVVINVNKRLYEGVTVATVLHYMELKHRVWEEIKHNESA